MDTLGRLMYRWGVRPHMAFVNSIVGGFGVAFGVLGVLAIANGLSTYVFSGQTIQEKVNARVGGGQ